MFLVQIGSGENFGRYSGVGVTVERATADLFHHFYPFSDGITISRRTTSVFKRCEQTSRFIPVEGKELALAIKAISDTLENLKTERP